MKQVKPDMELRFIYSLQKNLINILRNAIDSLIPRRMFPDMMLYNNDIPH